MRITIGIILALLLLLSTLGSGGDDEDGGLATAQANNMQSAKPDTRTVDFSSVKWAWNAARTHLEPDSFPDARVLPGSNVWRRDSGTGLIRIFSDTDLSGMSFSTSGASWPLSHEAVLGCTCLGSAAMTLRGSEPAVASGAGPTSPDPIIVLGLSDVSKAALAVDAEGA